MFSRLGGLASPSGNIFLSLSLLASPLEHILGFPFSLYPLFFLLLAWATFPGYGNVYFTFFVPCWAIPLERWQCLFIFPLCDSIVHDVCISIYACIWVIVHFLCSNLVATWVTLFRHECSWPCIVGMCPRHLL